MNIFVIHTKSNTEVWPGQLVGENQPKHREIFKLVKANEIKPKIGNITLSFKIIRKGPHPGFFVKGGTPSTPLQATAPLIYLWECMTS